MRMPHQKMKEDVIREVSLEQIDQRYAALRLILPQALARVRRQMQQTPLKFPLLCNQQGKALILLDGFKRYQILRELHVNQALVRIVHISEAEGQVAMLTVNGSRHKLSVLEEAWVIRSLVRSSGLSQKDVAALVKQHVSWVNRRLQLVERLDETVQDDIRWGLLQPTTAREIARLPRGKQSVVAEAIRTHGLSSRQAAELIHLLHHCDEQQLQAVIGEPLRYVEASRYPKRPNADDISPTKGSLGYWLLRMTESMQHVERLVGSLPADTIDREDATVLTRFAPSVIQQLAGVQQQLSCVLGPDRCTEQGHEP